MTCNPDLIWRIADDGKLGVFTGRALGAGEFVERCYCVPLRSSSIPGRQLQPWLYEDDGGADTNQNCDAKNLLFPLGWGALYNEVDALGRGPNLSWDHEVSSDLNGQQVHYINLRTSVEVEAGGELCVLRRFGCNDHLRDFLGAAIDTLEAQPGVTVLEPDVHGKPAKEEDNDADIQDGVYKSFAHAKVEMRFSPLHGNGVFAARPLTRGEVVELAPSLLIERWEVGECFIDHRYIAPEVKPINLAVKITLGLGSVFNHADEPNLHYRPVSTSNSGRAQKFGTCYFAARDIAKGEELCISYGTAWWKSRAHEEVSLADWRHKHGETREGRPFYDHGSFSQLCEVLARTSGQIRTAVQVEAPIADITPAGIEALHYSFVNAEDGATSILEAWKALSDMLKEAVQIHGCIDAPIRESGERATHRAAEQGRIRNLKWLVQNGADVNAATAPGLDLSADGDISSSLCPAHIAAIHGRTDVLTILQSAGADLNCRRPDGATPLDFAEDAGEDEVAAWLERRGGIRGLV